LATGAELLSAMLQLEPNNTPTPALHATSPPPPHDMSAGNAKSNTAKRKTKLFLMTLIIGMMLFTCKKGW
jgi:hypothetical protein